MKTFTLIAIAVIAVGCQYLSPPNTPAITALTLQINSNDYPINFSADKTASIVLPVGETIPAEAVVKQISVTGNGPSVQDKLAIANGRISITINGTDGTEVSYSVTVTVAIVPAIIALTLQVNSTDYPLSFAADRTASIVLPVGETIPAEAVVKQISVTGNGPSVQDKLAIANGRITITINGTDGTEVSYSVTVTVAIVPAITALTLQVNSTDYPINFSADRTASIVLPVGETIPAEAVVKQISVTGNGPSVQDKLAIANGRISITIDGTDGTEVSYSVTVAVTLAITTLTLQVNSTDYPINFSADRTASIVLPVGETIPAEAVVKQISVTGNGPSVQDKLAIANGRITITINRTDGTEVSYSVTVAVAPAITALTLQVNSTDYPLSFAADRTASIVLPVGETIPAEAVVKQITVIGDGPSVQDKLAITNGRITITINRTDGTEVYTVSVLTFPIIEIYGDSGKFHQSIKDDILADDTVLASISLPDGNYSYSFGDINAGKDTEAGVLAITKADLKTSSAVDGDQLRLNYHGQWINVAAYRPYEIHTWQDLQAMRQDLTGNYTLMNHIWFSQAKDDLPDTGFEPIGQDVSPGIGGGKDGFQGTVFSGTLDGNDKYLLEFTIDNPKLDYAGLFGKISAQDDETVAVKNLYFINPYVNANAVAGVLVGYLETGTVSDIYVLSRFNYPSYKAYTVNTLGHARPIDVPKVSLKTDDAGSPVFDPVISLSLSFVLLSAGTGGDQALSYTGGIAGIVGRKARMLNMYNEGRVSAERWVLGGIAGSARENSIIRGFNIGDVIGSVRNSVLVGGLVGASYGGMIIGRNDGEINGAIYLGGLAATQHGNQVIGFSVGEIVSPHDSSALGGLVGEFVNEGVIIGWSASGGKYYVNQPIVGYTTDTSLLKIIAYWDGSQFWKSPLTAGNSSSIQISIPDIANVKWDGNGYYNDTDGNDAKASNEDYVFYAPDFVKYFIINASSPGTGRWPILKYEHLSFRSVNLPSAAPPSSN